MQTLEKATIRNLDDPRPDSVVQCMFNPKEYKFTKSNSWVEKKAKQQNIPHVDFSSAGPMTLDMDLFFDTYEKGGDVRKYTDKIWKLMVVDKTLKDYGRKYKTHKGRPPLCEFRWGQTWSFQAAIESITQTFTLFLGDGTPVRSTLSVKFKQVIEEGTYPGQNPTTTSVPGYKTRAVRQGETIDWIAYDEYGDSTLWRVLADANDLPDPLRLQTGQLLAVPPKP